MFNVTDNAMNVLIKFLRKLILMIVNMANCSQELRDILEEMPTTLYAMQKSVKVDKNSFTKYSSCPECHSINKDTNTKYCKNVPFPAHPDETMCNANLLEYVQKKGKTVPQPIRLYFYQSLKSSLSISFQRPNFVDACSFWKLRSAVIPQDWLGDVYDWNVWKELQQTGFFDSPYNLALALNVDWFQPYKRVKDSVGVLYLVILNLPRHLRYKQENAILVGIIPGPKEPKYTINSYLNPLVDDLKEFWTGVNLKLQTGQSINVKVCLLCVSCDIPACRKVCGFVGHSAKLGCSKCFCEFDHIRGGGLKCSGTFGEWQLHSGIQHKEKCDDYLKCQSLNAQKVFASENGVRFSSLLDTNYFDPVRCHVVDPMHNLLLGTAKHMLEVWQKVGLINNSSFSVIENTASLLACLHDVGRLPLKIGSSFSGFTADQWKTWTLVYSPVALKGVIPDNHLRVWLLFVRACSTMCSKIIRKSDLETAHNYLKEFCLKFIDIYGNKHFTPNLHMGMHIHDCCYDFGSVYAFWCFAFERFNGILGSYHTNKRCIEAQIMHKFLQQQQVYQLPIPAEYEDYVSILTSSNQAKGSLKIEGTDPNMIVKLNENVLSEFETLQNKYDDAYFSVEDGMNLSPKIHEDVLSSELAGYIKQLYAVLYPKYELEHFSYFYTYSKSATFLGDAYECNPNRNSVYVAFWPSTLELTITKRICQINKFIKHQVTLKNIETNRLIKSVHIFCHVLWFKEHINKNWFGHSAFVCKTETEKESFASFIPLQRLIARCAFGNFELQLETEEKETVLVAVPMPMHWYAHGTV